MLVDYLDSQCVLTKWSTVSHTEGCIHPRSVSRERGNCSLLGSCSGDLCIFNTILRGGKRKNERGLPTERSQT